jgi:adenylate cyclase
MGIALIDFVASTRRSRQPRKSSAKISPFRQAIVASPQPYLIRGAKQKREAVARLLELEPNFRISEWVTPAAGQWRARLFIEGLRKARLRNDTRLAVGLARRPGD